jgi:transcriptional regulator with XRE-family HTH domain
MRLKAWRAQRLITQEGLAQSSGVSIHTIRGIEAGKHLPAVRTARRLAEALGVDPVEIDEVADAIEKAKKELVATAATS